MPHYRTLCVLVVAIVWFLGGCGNDDIQIQCENVQVDEIDVTVFNLSPPTEESTSVTIRGTASHASGLTIRQIIVDGKVVQNTGFNHNTWNVVLDRSQYDNLPSDGTNKTLSLKAIDACQKTTTLQYTIDPMGMIVDDESSTN